MAKTWHIITGEYPSQPGGVSDYTEMLAAGLAGEGCHVHVWCPSLERETPVHNGVEVHRFGTSFSPRSLLRLGKLLNQFSAPRLLLVQYAPNAFGLRGMNVPFCCWLIWRRLICWDDVRVMFHEPFFYFGWERPQRNLLALVQRLMAALLLAASRIAYLSIPAWEKMLGRVAWLWKPPMKWLPIPSTIPQHDDSDAVSAVRQEVTNNQSGKMIVGHFGTFGEQIKPELSKVIKGLLQANSDVLCVCIGTNSDSFTNEVIGACPELKERLVAFGFLSARNVSLTLQACDLLLQPYPDGVSSRRTSVMAGLAHGLPIVTTTGFLSEPVWRESGCVALSEVNDSQEFVQLAVALLDDPNERALLSKRAGQAYNKHFSLIRTLRELAVR